jgi:glyoxylase-like metal-dependent hydrolase (beta-lactamase superfamily II)
MACGAAYRLSCPNTVEKENAMHELPITRRSLLGGSAALAAAGLLGGRIIGSADAKAPMTNTQAPAFYRFKLGAIEATVVSDGPIGPLGEPSTAFLGGPKEEIGKMLSDNFLVTDNLVLEQNVLALNTGERLVLFDTGMGATKMFGPNTGRLMTSLKGAGIDPNGVDAVVLTHAHPDHCWGLMDDDGKPNFPNAQIYMAEADFEFWTDEAKLSQEMIKVMVEGTRKALRPNRERIVFVKDGQEFLPGIQAMAAPGHTVGHTVYIATSQGQSLCFAGDITHHHVLSVERPRLAFAFDTDATQAVSTRLRALDMFASQRLPFLAYHFPWPGIGHIAKQGDSFRYIAMPMRMVL